MNILNIILIILLVYILIQCYLCNNNRFFESMENKEDMKKEDMKKEDMKKTPSTSYSDYDSEKKNPYYLALKNASNISYLKDEMNGIRQMKKDMEELSLNVKQNTSNLTEIAKQIGEVSNKIVGK